MHGLTRGGNGDGCQAKRNGKRLLGEPTGGDFRGDLRNETGAANIYEGDAAKKWSEPTAYPLDRSVYGVYDMAGNVSEWTETIDAKSGLPVVRGGNFGNSSAEITRRVVNQPFITQSDRIGFRTAGSLR